MKIMLWFDHLPPGRRAERYAAVLGWLWLALGAVLLHGSDARGLHFSLRADWLHVILFLGLATASLVLTLRAVADLGGEMFCYAAQRGARALGKGVAWQRRRNRR